jgi:hypothetical protein
MSRTVVGFIPSGYLNSAASASPSGSTDAETGLPINTGLVVGAFTEYGDGSALLYTNPKNGQLTSIVQVTAGSGMTAGTYTLTIGAPPAGGTQAVGSVVVTATGLTSYAFTNVGSGYTAPPAVSISGTGGTTIILASTIGLPLYSGTYEWGQLDSAITGLVPVGTPLFWLQTATGKVVTTTSTADVNSPDFAGWSIDPNFGAALPYAFFQRNGAGFLLFGATGFPAAYGVVVNFVPGTADFTSLASGTLTVTQSTVGYSLATGTTGTACLCRVTWPIARF